MNRLLALCVIMMIMAICAVLSVYIYLDYFKHHFDSGATTSALVQLDARNKCRMYIITETRILPLTDRFMTANIEGCK